MNFLTTFYPPSPRSRSLSTLADPTDQNPKPKDDVFDYHCGFMNLSLLLKNFMDAFKEGDGERIVRCLLSHLSPLFHSPVSKSPTCMKAHNVKQPQHP